MPSARAVFRFTTSSYFVGCEIQNLLGFGINIEVV
jgi:hypothetical protein